MSIWDAVPGIGNYVTTANTYATAIAATGVTTDWAGDRVYLIDKAFLVPTPEKKKENAMEWLDRRVNEMRVRL